MKNNKLWHVIWIIGIYLVLIIVLYLVIIYKVKWENKDLSTYLYFYDCGNTLCTSTTIPEKYYNKLKCDYDICPYITEINNDMVVLSNNSKSWIYNYKSDKIINDKYIKYHWINKDTLVVANNYDLYGVINVNNELLVDFSYNYIKDYKNEYVVYSRDNYFGIDNVKEKNSVDATYEDITLINDKYFGYLDNNKYYIASLVNKEKINDTSYEYMYSFNNFVLVVKDKKIDILSGDDLKSKLLLKIDTLYSYSTNKEQSTLNIYDNFNGMLYFNVVTSDGVIRKYMYDYKNNKLY